MNIAIRKLALLEKNILEKEREAAIEGYATSPVDPVFREKVVKLMEKVRTI